MEKQVMIHLPYEPVPKPVRFFAVTQNWQCAVKIYPAGARNPIMIYGEGKRIVQQLRALADQIEGKTVAEWATPAAEYAGKTA